ncbi:MAG: RidA family protein [Burkholderiaceae bacterium]
MPITRIKSPAVTEPAPKRWSNCLRAGNQIYIAGLTSRAADGKTIDGDAEYEQTKIIFGKIKNLLEAGGASMNQMVKLTIFVTRIENNAEVWRAREEFFSGDFPTCSLVEVSKLAAPSIYVEIEGIAYVGE